MTTPDFIIALFDAVDQEMLDIPQHPEATLYLSAVVTLALVHAIKGGGTRAFYRWLTRDSLPLFPHVLERTAPTQPAQPGRRERREHAYLRHGTRVLINSLAVATGQIAWTMGATRKASDFVAPRQQAYQRLPRLHHDDWLLDNLNTHWSLAVCRVVARWCKVPCEPDKLKTGPQRQAFLTDPSHRHVLHCTPKHGSWLKQAE